MIKDIKTDMKKSKTSVSDGLRKKTFEYVNSEGIRVRVNNYRDSKGHIHSNCIMFL